MTLPQAIHKRICMLAKERALSLYALAKQCSVPRSTIATMPQCASVGSAVIYGICEGLSLSVKDFFDDPLFDRENIMD